MRILGVIPARGGSKRIPRKNLQSVGGMSLVERACQHAAASHLLDSWVVSTDDQEIMAAACNAGAIVLRRPPELARDDTQMAPVLLHAGECTHASWDAVVTIQPTSPLRTARDIDRCIALGLESRRSFVASVNAATGKRNGAVYFTDMFGLRDGYVFSETGLAYEMPPERSLDINTPEDLEEARRILGD